MKKFLIRFIPYMLLLFVCVAVFEKLVRDIPNDYNYKYRYLRTHGKDIHTLILGSSHTYRGINPVYLKQKAFSAANPSQSLEIDIAIANQVLDRPNKLRWIVVPISIFTFGSDLRNNVEVWRMAHYATYWPGLSLNYKWKEHFEILNGDFELDYSGLYLYWKYGKTNRKCNELGFSPLPQAQGRTDSMLKTTARSAIKRHLSTSEAVELKNIKLLAEFIFKCKTQNINILLLNTPVCEYYTNANVIEKYNRIESQMKQYCTNSNVRVYNLFKSKKFIATDFSDADHLNETGAKKLSIMLGDYIDKEDDLIKSKSSVVNYQIEN